jgi:hypothetical protein
MEYFEDQKATHAGLCSDPQCPCDETVIPVGQGYLYVPQSCCDFRWDCRSQQALRAKGERMAAQSGQFVMMGHGMAGPILVCETGARKRNLDLAVAAADARHWWATAQVPFRPTPQAGQPGVPFTKAGAAAASQDKAGVVGGVIVIAAAVAIWYFFLR